MDDAAFGLYVDELSDTAKLFKTPGKSIRAVDELISSVKLPCYEDNEDLRRTYLELLLNTPGALCSLNGVVLSEEALHQKTADGPDGHAQKFRQHREARARFAVWGDGPVIDASEPSEAAIRKQAKELALFATYCQGSSLVPIVYPKLSFDKTPSIVKFADLTKKVLTTCVAALNCQGAHRGNPVDAQDTPEADQQFIARNTFRVLKSTVPPAIPAIAFLSSGHSEDKAVIAMKNLKVSKPWSLSSFFGPPLQQRTLKAKARNDSPHSPQDTRRAEKRPRGTKKGDLQPGEGTSKSPNPKGYKH